MMNKTKLINFRSTEMDHVEPNILILNRKTNLLSTCFNIQITNHNICSYSRMKIKITKQLVFITSAIQIPKTR